MRTYEALYVARSEKSEDEIQTMAKGVETLITENGGSIVRSEVWGKRRLAYKVEKNSEGVYILVRFQSGPDFVQKLREHFRLEEDIFRHVVIHFDEKTLALEAEQDAKNKALAEARIASGSTFAGRGGRSDSDDAERPRRPRREESRPAAASAEEPKTEEAKPEETAASTPETEAVETKVAETESAETESPETETESAETESVETKVAEATETSADADTPDEAPEPAAEVKA